MLLRVLVTRHLEIIRQLKLRLFIALERLKVHNQRVLDRKHGIVFNVLALPVEYLRNDRFIARRREL